MEDIKRYPGDSPGADTPDNIITSITLKLSVKTRDDSLIEDQLEHLLTGTGLRVFKTLSTEEPTIRFLQVYLERLPRVQNSIVSNGKDIQVLYEIMFDLKCEFQGVTADASFIAQLRKKKFIVDIFPMHNKSDKQFLTRNWVGNIFGKQPIFAINDYFGTEIATYFSWMGFYTTSLIVPCLVGLTQKAHQYHNPETQISWVAVAGVAMNFFWAAFFLLGWGSINDTVLPWSRDRHSTYVRRTEFSPKAWIPQRVKQFISLLVTVLMFLLLIATSYVVLKFDYMTKESLITNNDYPKIPDFIKTVLILIPEILLSFSIIFFDVIYTGIADKLTRWENYELTTSFNTAIMAKLIIFRLFNSFHTLFYIGFVLQDLEMLEVRLMNLLIVQQIKANVGEVMGSDLRVKLLQVLVSLVVCSFLSEGFVVSIEKLLSACGIAIALYICKRMFLGQVKFPKFLASFVFRKDRKKHGSSVEKESEQREYDSTYLDYLEMLIQYGYILLFSPAYPLAATFALANNLVEIHTDAFRLVKMSKRPFPAYASPSRFWRLGFTLMTFCGIITNSLLIRNSKVFGEIPLKRSIFLFCVLFGVAYIGVRKFLEGVERNIEESSESSEKVE